MATKFSDYIDNLKSYINQEKPQMAGGNLLNGTGSYVVSNPGHNHQGLCGTQSGTGGYISTGCGGAAGAGGAGGYIASFGNQNPTTSVPIGQAIGQAIYVGPPTGSRTMVCFTDARGLNHAIEVDQSYVSLLAMISQQHLYGYGQQYQQALNQQAIYNPYTNLHPAPAQMLEGDFSEDEMTQAELIIEEMKHGQGQEENTAHQ